MTNKADPPLTAEGGAAPDRESAACDPALSPDPDSPSDADLAALCAELAEALYNPGYGTAMLRRQAQLLDHLLYAVAARRVEGGLGRGRAAGGDDGLGLLLTIQKRCVETVKTVSAIEYMQAIAPRPPLPLSSYPGVTPGPLPPKTGKQTDKET